MTGPDPAGRARRVGWAGWAGWAGRPALRRGAVVTLALAGSWAVFTGLAGSAPPQPVVLHGDFPAALAVPRAAGPAAARTASLPVDGLPRSAPVSVQIPSIGVDAPVAPVGRDQRGAIDVPAPTRSAGATAYWYRDLASPGEVGPAVIVGHVDSARDGPAVFFRLGELRPGDQVLVRRADGARVVFVVQEVGRYPKDAFPDRSVYGPTDRPALRLITCGGSFDPVRGSYRDNVVVFASASDDAA
jgi:hypothetical protein